MTRYQLMRYQYNPSTGQLDPKPFPELTNTLNDFIFCGDTLDNGLPQSGQKFKLSNVNLPLLPDEQRMFTETSTVIDCLPEQTTEVDGGTVHIVSFTTKNSEYRLSWLSR